MKVILVDDSGLSRKVQAKVLREVGADTVVEAKDGVEALSKLEENDYRVDLLLTDWNMPSMDGIALIQEIRKSQRGRHVPIIVVSSEFEEERIGRAFAAGANGYVTKPFKKEVLARKLASARELASLEDTGSGGGGDAPLMEGDLERLGFAELVGFLNFSNKSGELVVEVGGEGAGLALEEGEVVDAWLGGYVGEEGFYAVARLQSGHFRFHEGRPARSRRVEKPTLTLLMDAVRALDEEAADA